MAELPNFISAEMPLQSRDPELYNLVTTLMTYQCSTAHCLHNGVCKHKFPAGLTEQAYVDEQGYTHYQCQTETDQNVVSYNPELLQIFQCHINIELLTGAKVIAYIFKYCQRS